MTIQTHFIKEPLLQFGNGQRLEHPQDGLFLYGPVDAGGNPEVIHVGVVGTNEGVQLVTRWLTTVIGRIPVQKPDQLHTSPWPGFQAAFGGRLESKPLVTISISGSDISNAIRKTNRHDAVRSTVRLFEDAILEHLRTDERRPNVWLVVVPEIVHRYGRPQVGGPKDSTPSSIMSERVAAPILRGGGSLFPDMANEAQIYLFARNFHHQLKAQLRAQDAEKLRRQHHVAVFGALAVTHQNHSATAIDILDSEPGDLRGAKPRRMGGRQSSAALQA